MASGETGLRAWGGDVRECWGARRASPGQRSEHLSLGTAESYTPCIRMSGTLRTHPWGRAGRGPGSSVWRAVCVGRKEWTAPE